MRRCRKDASAKTHSRRCHENRVVLENSNMAKLASNEYLSVHSQPKEDRHDIDDASSGKVYNIFMPQSRLSAVQSLQRRHDRSSFLDGQTPAHRTAALHRV